MSVDLLIRIERMNYILGALLAGVAAFVMARSDAMGVLVGAVLSCVNFTVMRRLVQRWLAAPPDRRGPQSLLILPKMVGLMVLMSLAMWLLPISGLGVLIGFSVFLASIAVEMVRYVIVPPPSKPEADE
ncbi:hypothetical protein [Haliangium sp.]|uniref:hypothetical protein n=1 Tax=Haliangium sp. TaxID=2663208 RepID=UPI003D0FE1B0